jgi:hypothetical protein
MGQIFDSLFPELDITVHLQASVIRQEFRSDSWELSKGQSRRLEGFTIQPYWASSVLQLRYYAHIQRLGNSNNRIQGQFVGRGIVFWDWKVSPFGWWANGLRITISTTNVICRTWEILEYTKTESSVVPLGNRNAWRLWKYGLPDEGWFDEQILTL